MPPPFVHPFDDAAAPDGFAAVPPEPAGNRWVVARGPDRTDPAGGKASAPVLAFDGDALWYAPSASLPEALWIRVASDDVAGVHARYTADTRAGGADATVFLGLLRDAATVADTLLDEDPFCSSLPVSPGPESGRGTPSSRHGVETLYSRSLLTFEAYGALVTARVDYTPDPDAPEAGAELPAGLPVDAAAVLLRWPAQGPAGLRVALASPPGRHLVPVLIAAELIGAPLVRDDLAPLAAHADPELRRAALEVAGRRGWTDVLADARASETDPRIQRMITHYITGAPHG